MLFLNQKYNDATTQHANNQSPRGIWVSENKTRFRDNIPIKAVAYCSTEREDTCRGPYFDYRISF